MARARDEMVDFYRMNEAELQDWVEFNAGRVNDGDRYGNTALYATVYKNYPSLVLWLLNEKGADLSATTSARLLPASAPSLPTSSLTEILESYHLPPEFNSPAQYSTYAN